jgi:ribosomal protein S18 acetylase RimI-like enzyme
MSTIRPAAMSDLEPTATMLNEHGRSLHGADDMTAADLLQYWESPDVEFPGDVLVAESSDGAIAGYADLGVHGEHVWLDVRSTDPDLLPLLLEAIQKRASAKAPGKNLIGVSSGEDQAVRDLYEGAGYSLLRHSFRMRIDLDVDPPAPEWPDGFDVRTMREEEDRRFYDAQMASFADTWMFNPEPYEVWSHWMVGDSAFDPSLWFVAESGGALAGVLMARSPENEPGLGWVRILGVLPDYRQRGVGQALLRHTFGEFARRGFKAVGLGVDAENPTGAVRLYEKAGMYVERTNLIYERSQG